jgi:16S rRNA (guanine966-N2)-methyltransferase
MRIVAGRHRGRVLLAPDGHEVRPTSDRAREALFNILEHGFSAADGSPIAERHVLDVFAGTGAIGLEALSRGAAHATFLELKPRVLKANVAALGEQARSTVLAIDATKPPRATTPAALAFLDPPYGEGLVTPALTALARQGWLEPTALVVVEIAAKEEFVAPAGFTIADERRYGAARLVFLSTATG